MTQMNIHLKLMTSKTVTLAVEPTTTIAQVLDMFHEREGIEPRRVRLAFGGKALAGNEKTLAEFGVQDGANVYVMINIYGEWI